METINDLDEVRVSHPATRYGILMTGLPVTKKYDKLLNFLSNKYSAKIWGRTAPIKTELLYKSTNGIIKTTGEAIFIFKETLDEIHIARCSDGIRLDKRHTLKTRVIEVCKTCNSDIYGQTDCGNTIETVSKIDSDSCRTCVPDKLCCCCAKVLDPMNDNFSSNISCIYKYISCKSCRENIEEQEKWRNSIPIHDTESSYKEPKYLCDEAIIREKELMGGKAPVSEDWVTPFMISYSTELLVDPKSNEYWPYGMSGRDYVALQDQIRFDNPMNETPDDSWMDIDVTEEILEDYWKRMLTIQTEFNFKSLTDIGTLPTTMSKDDKSYRLIPDTHGFTCDDPTCQAIFQKQNDLDGGCYAALIVTGIPIYTSRTGDLTSESVSELGYGKEYCLACIVK